MKFIWTIFYYIYFIIFVLLVVSTEAVGDNDRYSSSSITTNHDNNNNKHYRGGATINTASSSTSSRTLTTDEPSSVLLPQSLHRDKDVTINSDNYNDVIVNVRKRDGHLEALNVTKIQQRIEKLLLSSSSMSSSKNNNNNDNNTSSLVDIESLCTTIVRGLYDDVTTDEIDILIAETTAAMSTQHPIYGKLAAQILISRNKKITPNTFTEAIQILSQEESSSTRPTGGFIHPDIVDIVKRRGDEINEQITTGIDEMTYFGFKTLERAYLLRSGDRIIERPEYLIMRVALGIHCCNNNNDNNNITEDERLQSAFETYHLMKQGYFTHASPTLFHSGTIHPQLSSCFLVQMNEDSIIGIYETLKQCAIISKSAGGIGLSVHNIRARGTPIHGTRGVSNGLVPMLRVYDVTSRYVDQGGGKRPGAFAIYIEPWHADIFDVLNLKKNHGKEEQRARDLFYGLWIPSLFMKRVENDDIWSLMCPHQCPGLSDCYGTKFDELYIKYEKENKFVRQIRARELWYAILESQIETGTPYMLYKDSCNIKSNQQNLGTIQCSNLCTEIIQYTSKNEVAVCNLASICLPKFVISNRGPFGSINKDNNKAYFDHAALHETTKIITRNLNKIIDINNYPVPESQVSNTRHRPIGIGVSGLADTFIRLGLPFTSPEAKQLNAAIFETIYHAALEASVELAAQDGPYETFHGSPASEGKLQFDLWDDVKSDEETPSHIYASLVDENDKTFVRQMYEDRFTDVGYDWNDLRQRIMKTGLRNSLLLAPMPTASTSQILGVNECFEPFSSNLYVRRVKAGEFIMTNPHLLQDLTDRGLWTSKVRNQLMHDGGSVQNIAEIPKRLKELYKTVWEIKMKDIIDMAADRGKYIDQSQSLNLFIADPTIDKLTAMHFYAWKKGLKTGMYYLRTKPAVNAIQYTVDKTSILQQQQQQQNNNMGSIPNADRDDICLSCQG